MSVKKADQKRKIAEDLPRYLKALDVKKLYEKPGHKTSKDWLAEVAAIFKSLDKTDFEDFSNLKQHLYPSIPLVTRKHAAEQIDVFVRQKVAEYKNYGFDEPEPPTTSYVKQEIVEGFIRKEDEFDYKKLIRLVDELNLNYAAGYPYSTSMLIRGILDHIPPLLGASSFGEVVSSYPWRKTDKRYMEKLLDFKSEGDDALHRQISKDQDLLEMGDLPSSNRVNRLLQECLKVGGTAKPISAPKGSGAGKQSPKLKIDVKMVEDRVSWANYSVSRYIWSSFRVKLEVDNFKSNGPDYVSVSMIADSPDGRWVGNHFIFEGADGLDEKFYIGAHKVRKVTVFISDHVAARSEPRKPMPKIDKKTLKLKVETKSGAEFDIPIEESNIVLD